MITNLNFVPPAISLARRRNLMMVSTFAVIGGAILGTVLSISADNIETAFSSPAYVMGVALLLAFAFEMRAGIRNIIRVDLFMLAVLYLLTFLEFVFPQELGDTRVTIWGAQTAVMATLVGFAGIVIGRHFVPPSRSVRTFTMFSVSARTTMFLLVGCFFVGYLYMFLAVRFDPFELFYQLSRPRFSQPWTRGRLGGIYTLLNELGLLSYLIPPLVASIFVQAKRYSLASKLLAIVLLTFVFYETFASGTRNVFLTHLATFSVTFFLLQPKLTFFRFVRTLAPLIVLAAFVVYYMIEIRTFGLQNFSIEASRLETVFVDMNLLNVAMLAEVFPQQVDYLGLEIPFTALIRPIPRALWSGKPEGLSVSIEEVIGVSGMTLSATFVGEFWMAGGYLWIAIFALVCGSVAGAWNRFGSGAKSNLELILFASGFFPAGLCMRSFLSMMPALLPVIALSLYIKRRGNKPNRPPFVSGRRF